MVGEHMAILDIIQKLEAASGESRQDIEQIILDLWISGERNFFIAAQLASNFDINYHIGSVPKLVEEIDGFVSSFTWDDFHLLTKKLRSTKYDIKEKKSLVIDAAEGADALEWNNFYRHILLKQFPWVKIKTINKILRKLSLSDKTTLDYLVCEFTYQESHNENATNNLKNIRGVKTVSPVHPGHICLFIINKEERTAIIYHKVNGDGYRITFDQDVGDIYDTLPCSMVIECMTELQLQDTNTVHMVDCLPLHDFYRGECLMPYRDRQSILTGVLGVMLKMINPKFKVVQKLTIDFSTEQGRINLEEFQQQLYDDGIRNIYVKNPDASYQVGKTKNKNSIMLTNKLKSNG
jgi:hypothetical protein